MDEPRGTPPLLYKHIDEHATIFEVFKKTLTQQNAITEEEAVKFKEAFTNHLRELYNSMEETELSEQKVPELPEAVANDLKDIDHNLFGRTR